MTIINCDDCKEYEVINREQAEQITNLQDEAEQIAEDLADADEVIARLKEELAKEIESHATTLGLRKD